MGWTGGQVIKNNEFEMFCLSSLYVYQIQYNKKENYRKLTNQPTYIVAQNGNMRK